MNLVSRIAVIFLLLVVEVALPDTVVLRNGNQVRGVIVASDGDMVRIATTGGELRITSDTISRVIRGQGWENGVLEAEMELGRRGVMRGFQYYAQARNNGAPAERLAGSIAANQDAILSGFGALEDKNKREVSRFVESLGESGNDEYRFFAGQVLFEAGEREGALTFFASLPAEFYERHAKRKEFVVSLFRNEVKSLLAKDKFEQAINRVELLNRLDATLGRSCEVLLYLNMAAKARETDDFEQALKIYSDQLFNLSPPIARERLLFTLEKLADRAQETGDYAKAIDLAEKYGLRLSPLEAKVILADMRERYARQQMESGNFDRAKAAIARYYEDLPNEPKTLLFECAYRERSARLSADDYAGHYELAHYCLQNGLLEQAQGEFETASGAKELRENARKQLHLIAERKAMNDFGAAMQLYERGLFMDAFEALLHFEQNYEKSDLVKEAQKMIQLCRGKLESEAQRRPYQAEVLYQQAERSFFGGKVPEAMRQLEVLESEFGDTPAGARATKLKKELVRQIEIAKLEGENKPDLDLNKVKASYSRENIEEEIAKILKATEE